MGATGEGRKTATSAGIALRYSGAICSLDGVAAMQHSFPASKQVPLAIGERLCDLAFLDPKGQPFSLYDHHLYGWPKAIFLANSAASEAALLGPASARHA